MSIVVVDSDEDEVLAACQAYRRAHVYPAFEAHGLTVWTLGSAGTDRTALAAALADPRVVLLSACGHGEPATLIGRKGEPLLEANADAAPRCAGQVVHLLACSAGLALGPDLVDNGCDAFFGYDAAFVIPLGAPALFLECDAVIDREIVAGRTARAVYERAHGAFTRRVEQLLALKQPYLAAILEYNRDHLCAPSTDPRWGDPDATI